MRGRLLLIVVGLAVLGSGCVPYSWGNNDYGQLGNGTIEPPATLTPPQTPTQFDGNTTWDGGDAGGFHGCGLRAGSLWCWGQNEIGQIGDGTGGFGLTRPSPTRVGSSSEWTAVSAGLWHTCGIRAPGTLWCWGLNNAGQVGDGTIETQRPSPTQVGSLSDWTAVSAGLFHTCGTRTPGTLWCWGSNWAGEVGDGTSGTELTRPSPTQVGSFSDWSAVTAGGHLNESVFFGHTCGIRAPGTLWCWGGNDYGQIGDGTNGTGLLRTVPTRVGTFSDWTGVSGGARHTCGVRAPGTSWCWGGNEYGQIGDGTNGFGIIRNVPTRVGTFTNWGAVSAGFTHTCGKRRGELWCWGLSDGGIGNGALDSPNTPTRIGTGTNWAGVSVGVGFTLAMKVT